MLDSATNASASWFPLLTALGGYLTSVVTEYFRDRRTREREREAREAARRLQLFERRSDFQRETLLSLQEVVMQLVRAVGRMQHMDEMEYRKTGKWGVVLFPEELDSSAREFTVKVLMLMVRVRDDDIREMAKTFRDHTVQASLSKTKEAADRAVELMVAALNPLHERIGLILRKLDDDETSEVKK